MKNEAGAVAAVSNLALVPPAKPVAPPARPAPPAPSSANLRLVIEEDQTTGDFIYTTLDRATGEVVLQLPRKEVLRSIATGKYSAGDVIKARV